MPFGKISSNCFVERFENILFNKEFERTLICLQFIAFLKSGHFSSCDTDSKTNQESVSLHCTFGL